VPALDFSLRLKPVPADNFQVGEIGLPKLVGGGGFGVEFIAGFHYDKGLAGDQVMGFAQMVDGRFRDERLKSRPSGAIPQSTRKKRRHHGRRRAYWAGFGQPFCR